MLQTVKYTEPQLLQLIIEGDAKAFKQVFNDLARPLVYFGIKLTGNQSEPKMQPARLQITVVEKK